MGAREVCFAEWHHLLERVHWPFPEEDAIVAIVVRRSLFLWPGG